MQREQLLSIYSLVGCNSQQYDDVTIEAKIADDDLQLQFSNLSRQQDHILSTQEPLETVQFTEEKFSRALVGLGTSVSIPNKIKTDLF